MSVVPTPGGTVPTTPTSTSDGISPRMVQTLRETRPWVRFISVLGLLVSVLMIVGGVCTVGSTLLAPSNTATLVAAFGPTVIGIVCVVPSVLLSRYAGRLGGFAREPGASQLEAILESQRSFWRLLGALCIVLLVICASSLAVLLINAIISQ